jgi:hypothetical protein
MILLVATYFTRTTKVTAVSGDFRHSVAIDSSENVLEIIKNEVEVGSDPVTDVVFTGNETKVSKLIKEYFSGKGAIIKNV